MFNSCVLAEAIGPGFDADGESDCVDSIVEVEMRASSQPLPDGRGILNGKYLLGSNESILIWLTSDRALMVISMEDLERVCRVPAKSWKVRNAEIIAASKPYAP